MTPENEEAVVVPYRQLGAETLRSVVESFVNREGTDYGHRDISLERKVGDVMRQLERGEVVVVYEAKSATVSIVPVDDSPGE